MILIIIKNMRNYINQSIFNYLMNLIIIYNYQELNKKLEFQIDNIKQNNNIQNLF